MGFGGGGFGGGGFGGPGKGPSLGDFHAYKSTRSGSSSGLSSNSGGCSGKTPNDNKETSWVEIGASLVLTALGFMFIMLLVQLKSCMG